ncbi:molybdopterin-dependent oxidoreductase [Streptomyces broussonetiae]|uniref:Molybdopterin-dependent oxidoreductase n=2 Tax=Streptomyces broussonetiae TaxID=2686304 RepID=A0A6I6NP80_9ACTN|nr:molybdopterin-dependent oxidoreductase [Streptomyces broussonetiae]
MLVHQDEPYNAETPPDALVDRITSLEAFYGRNHAPIPRIDSGSWRLRVDGLVGRPLELSMDDLRRFRERTVVATLQCAGNRRADLIEVRDIPGQVAWGPGAISTASWSGAGLADVLAEAGIRPEAAHIAFEGADESQQADPPQLFGGSVPLAKATSSEVLLAWSMNGQALPPAHGAPLRVIVPGWIGARSVKWLQRISALAEPTDNYFQTEYSLLPPEVDPRTAGPGDGITLGPIAIHCAFLRPCRGARLTAGPTEVSGFAFAGDDRTVARVDVSADRGSTWIHADLDPPANPWTWQHWRATLTLPPGEGELVARAWDSTAAVQTESPATVWNPRGYANNAAAHLHISCSA